MRAPRRRADRSAGSPRWAVWIVTDNADWSGLGALVADGEWAIDAGEAAAAMGAIDQNGVSITTKAIWSDRATSLSGVTDASLRSWLQNRG
jgi:hypothetical protein